MTATKPAPTSKTLRHLPVPERWAGLPHLWPIAWTLLAVGVGIAVWAFTESNLELELVAIALGIWAFLLCTWLARPTQALGRFLPSNALIAWTLVCVAGAWWYEWTTPAIALAAATLAALAAGGWILGRRRRLARKMVWLAQGIGPATSDQRPPSAILRPTWGASNGLPITWHYPAAMTPTDKRMAELEELATARLQTPVSITWQPGSAVIDERPDKAPEAPSETDPLSDRLTAVLHAMIPGAKITTLTRDEDGQPDEIAFTWPPERAVRVTPVPYRARVSRALQSALGFPIDVRWDIATDQATARPVPTLPDAIAHPPRDVAHPMKAAFGQFRGGGTAVWDLNSTLPHVLIVGGTGGGKTVLMLTLLTALPQTDAITTDVHVIDPKRVGFKGVHGNIPGVRKPATTAAAFVDTLERVQGEMDRRYAALEDDRITRDELQPIVLFIDEGQEMYDVLKTWWVGGEGKADWMRRHDLEKAPTGSEHPAMGLLGSILRLGREARVHVVLASQQAAASWLQTSSRGQFAVRIALRNLSVDDSRMVFGSPVATAGLENTPGRAWVSTGLGAAPQHAQIYWTPKIERGLSPADRGILHGLGVTLPDDEPDTAPEAPASPTAPVEVAPLAAEPTTPPAELDESGDGMSPRDVASEAPSASVSGPSPEEFADVAETPVTAVEDGERIVVDTDDGPALATVETVDPDDTDPEYLAVTYRLDDGELGVLSLRDDETVPVLAAR